MGKNAIVFGATSGIGMELVKLLVMQIQTSLWEIRFGWHP